MATLDNHKLTDPTGAGVWYLADTGSWQMEPPETERIAAIKVNGQWFMPVKIDVERRIEL